jgi:hypothetical protein
LEVGFENILQQPVSQESTRALGLQRRMKIP